MPAYKDKNTGKWYVKFYYGDADGTRRQKLKRGFELKRDAEKYERDFLALSALADKSLAVPWPVFCDLYFEDVKSSLSANSQRTIACRLKIIKQLTSNNVSDIKPSMIEAWISPLLDKYSLRYTKALYTNARAIFNHAVRVYGLTPNPCDRVQTPYKREAKKEMLFWTFEEYSAFIKCVDDIKARTAIELLYWSGLRKGELFALTWEDLDGATLTVSKSLQRINGENVITPPKTSGSNRTLLLPSIVLQALQAWRSVCADTSSTAAVFPWENRFIENAINNACQRSGVKWIRVHDLRHSHASLLISKGANIKLVSARLGHVKTSITLDTYGHLYPSDEHKIIEILEDL